ncbi:FHA domain-containing protein [Stigmatella aurantiaca]|uniref:FHA domain protein n=1 Tax=Stigmatella aurantiaca (strain DW4/3-1) TaxID=378806 RepID=Q093C0_STIAD|nr:FHA domain-containing protein [Stigmatella aurantiaca]ADO76120.1 FHA domain protein [Stigmatella aurantiaca DW4/3-1]EAU66836.1 FHA domain protein [Stigmatella aurantiaca DW4/3-1]
MNHLTFTAGPLNGRRIQLMKKEVIIGSLEGTLILEGDKSASGKHAKLTVSKSGVTLEDLGSLIGTKVNGKKLSGPVTLAPGDTIQIGESVATFNSMVPKAPSSPLAFGAVSSSSSAKKEEEEEAATPVLEIHHIDVGQGDATLIQIRNGAGALAYSMLIDTGRTGAETASYLDTLIHKDAFRRIDACVISHYDSDHIGGARAVFQKKYLQDSVCFYDLGVPLDAGDTEYTDYANLAILKDKRQVLPLDTPLVDLHGVKLRCLAYNGFMKSERSGRFWSMSENADVPWADRTSHIPAHEKNHCSAALLLEFGAFRYFTAGDLCGYYEDLVCNYMNFFVADRHVCAWKLGHHGAAEATSPKLLSTFRPRFGVISCGSDNGYGHPAQDTLNRLEKFNESLFKCSYFVTARVVPATGQKFSIGQLPPAGSGSHNQGTVVIRVTGEQARTHAFTVSSKSFPSGTKFNCGMRAYDAKAEDGLKVSTNAAKRKQTPESILLSKKRKEDREAPILTAITQGAQARFGTGTPIQEAWWSAPGVAKHTARIARSARSNYSGEAVRRVQQLISSHQPSITRIESAGALEAFLQKILK